MTIVLSYHGNRESEAALNEALILAGHIGTSVMIVVAQNLGSDDSHIQEDAGESLWSRLDKTNVPFEIRYTQQNDQAITDAVLNAATQTEADFIVLGLTSAGFGSTKIGPNATRILLDAPCSVVTTTIRN